MEKYCLRWNEFETNIRHFFGSFRKEQKLFDVSLVSEDGQQLKAHRIILSAGSQFFKNIFDINEDKNLLIYLKGVRIEKLKCIIDFLYNGEVNISQEDLDEFLIAANELQLIGLEMKKDNSEQKDTKEIMLNNERPPKFPEYYNELNCDKQVNFEKEIVLFEETAYYLDNYGDINKKP